MELTGAEIIIQTLIDKGIDTVFGYPGGKVLPLYDAFYKQDKMKHILTRHEQGAAHAAEGFARSTGRVGVVFVTSGPGATNIVTGLADANMDSIPIVCFSGQVATHEVGTDAFQEADVSGITRSCTKYNYLVTDITKLEETIYEAFYIARTGRPGPVMIDVPVNIQNAKTEYQGQILKYRKSYNIHSKPNEDLISQAVELISNAKKPIFYVGGGVINANASDKLKKFVNLTGFPITTTLMALGAYSASSSKYKNQFLGMTGMHGTAEANMAMHDCDVMINIGARFDDRVTSDIKKFSPNSKKIHIDIDASSINKVIKVDIPIVADAKEALKTLIKEWKKQKPKVDISDWWVDIEKWRGLNSLEYNKSDEIIKPQTVLEKISELAKGKDVIFATDVGQHQMWAAQYLQVDKPRKFITSGGLGTMGYGMPAGMGASVGNPKSKVITISGDSSIMMNIQELATIAQYKLPVKIVVLNNNHMGMVRQWQEWFFDERYSQTVWEPESMPDLVKLAESFGIKGLRCSNPADLDVVVDEIVNGEGALLVDMIIDPSENVLPMIAPGAAHNKLRMSS